MSDLKFVFRATECNGWPKLRLSIDSHTLLEYEFSGPEGEVSLNLDIFSPGKHTLCIERWGKLDSNVVFQDGKILQDQTVELKSIWYQDVQIPESLYWLGVFYFNDVQIPAGLLWGPNGKWQWDIELPFMKWAIYQHQKKLQPLADIYIPGCEDIDSLMEELNSFEKKIYANRK